MKVWIDENNDEMTYEELYYDKAELNISVYDEEFEYDVEYKHPVEIDLLQNHDYEVRKQVCDRIIDLAQIYSFGYAKDCYAITEKDLHKILHMVQIDQIKGGINDK